MSEPETPEETVAPRVAGRASIRPPHTVLRVLGHRYGVTGLVLLAVLALAGVAVLSRPSGAARTAAPDRIAVRSAVVACPAQPGARISALTPPGPQRGGDASVTWTDGGAPVGTMTATGVLWVQDLPKPGPATTGSLTVHATGPVAAGFEAEQATASKKGDDRGLAAVRCTEPGTDLWFLGPGPVAAKHLELYLTDVDDQPASVDLSALSDAGPLDTTDGRGTAVNPHSTRVVQIGASPEGLGSILSQATVLALHVHVTTGRVSAAVRVRVGAGRGVDWEPLTSAPATSLVVPGIPGGNGTRQLLVGVSGQADAKVKVEALTAAGTFAPAGQSVLAAPGQTVTTLDLAGALGGKAAAIRLTSDHPIVAGLQVERDGDVAYGAAAPPIGSGGVVADNRADSVVLLTAPDAAASVRISYVSQQGVAGGPQDVRIDSARTVEVRLAVLPGGAGIVITPVPGSGPVYAARLLTQDKMISLQPILPAPAFLTVPAVGDSLTSLIP